MLSLFRRFETNGLECQLLLLLMGLRLQETAQLVI